MNVAGGFQTKNNYVPMSGCWIWTFYDVNMNLNEFSAQASTE